MTTKNNFPGDRGKRPPVQNQMWKLFYIMDGKVKETPENLETRPKPRAVVEAIKKRLEATTYRAGKLVVVPDYTKPEDYFPKLPFKN